MSVRHKAVSVQVVSVSKRDSEVPVTVSVQGEPTHLAGCVMVFYTDTDTNHLHLRCPTDTHTNHLHSWVLMVMGSLADTDTIH